MSVTDTTRALPGRHASAHPNFPFYSPLPSWTLHSPEEPSPASPLPGSPPQYTSQETDYHTLALNSGSNGSSGPCPGTPGAGTPGTGLPLPTSCRFSEITSPLCPPPLALKEMSFPRKPPYHEALSLPPRSLFPLPSPPQDTCPQSPGWRAGQTQRHTDTHTAAPSKSEEVGAAPSARAPPAEGQQAPGKEHTAASGRGPRTRRWGGGAQKPECPPGLGATKRSAATGSGRGGHGPSTHGQSVGPEGADRGLSPPIRIPTPCVSSLGRLPGPEVQAVSTGERQDAHDSGVHKTPSRAWTLGLTSLLGSALPNPRTREPGRVHPALSSAGPVTLPRPLSPLSPAPGASAARPLGHTSWARPPAPSPQVPPWQPPSASAPRRGHSWLPRLPGRWWQGPLPSRRTPLGGPARPGCWDAAATAQAVRVRNPGGARAEHSPTARAATQIPPTVRYK